MTFIKFDKKIPSQLWLAFRPYRKLLLLLVPLMFLKSSLEALMATVLVPLLDQLIGVDSESNLALIFQVLYQLQIWLGSSDILLSSFLLLVTISILSIVVTISVNYTNAYLLTIFEKDKRDELFRRILQVNWLYYLDQRAGALINTIIGEVIKSRQWFGQAIRLVDGLLSILLYTLVAVYISPSYILIVLLAALLLALIMFPILQRMRRYGAQLVEINQDLMQQLTQFLLAVKVVKASRMEEIAQEIVEKQTFLLKEVSLKANILKTIPAATLQPISLIFVAGLLYIVQVYQLGTISELAIISLLLLRTFQRLSGLQGIWAGLSGAFASVLLTSELPTILEQHKERRPRGKIEQFQLLDLRGVSFSYKLGHPALLEIELKIKQGEFIGIVGESGAGKTTLVDLILGLIKPNSGEIKANQFSLSQLDPYSWRELIGYVPQETILFNDTVINNITLRRDGIAAKDVYWATRIADADDFIRSLSDGYATSVGDRGAALSGGQRQRLALARALACKPQILLMDEGTSSLDSFSEHRIQQAIEQLRGKLTIIVIAHRISTIMNADRIIVLEKGRIVEADTPANLLRSNGKFAKMHQLQTRQ